MISNVYSYYMAEYGIRPYNKHSAHKKSELKDLYNNIVKLNRSNPFYKIDVSEESQKQAIDIKESARALSDITGDLTDAASGDMTFKNIATSSNEDVLTAEYVGDNKSAGTSKSFTLKVAQLASPQVNTGNYVNPRARNLFTGTYSFDIDISSITYELQFQVRDNENNQDIQNRIARLINNSNTGLSAKVLTNPEGRTALELTSNMTGIGDKPTIFDVNDDHTTDLSGVVEAFGLNNTTQYPSNAVFELNGDMKTSSSNTFTVDKEFEIHLKDTSEDDTPVTVSMKQNMDSLVDSLHELADSYNHILSVAHNGTNTSTHRLYSDLRGIANTYTEALVNNGIDIDSETGAITVDDEKLKENSSAEEMLATLKDIGKFKNALQNKASNIMLDPMEYINKSVVSYKNPARPTGDTYTTSIYSGMMYNGYC
mgnify:CR=1 FL=1